MEKIYKLPDRCHECNELCISKIEFMQDLPVSKQRQILTNSRLSRYREGDYVFEEGDEVKAIYLIKKGRIKLSTYDVDGRESIIGIFSAYDIIWEGLFLTKSTFPYSAICLTKCEVCKIYRNDFESSVSDPAIAMKTVGLLSKKLHDANVRNKLLSVASPKARLAGFILYRKEHTTDRELVMKLDTIAASIALRPETVSRKMKELEKDGLVKRVGQSGIEIVDFDGLKDAADE